MKSKAARMSNKNVNLIHQNIIHEENIRKETNFFSRNRMEHFQLNPTRMTLLAEKPNYVDPRGPQKMTAEEKIVNSNPYTDDPVEEAFSNEKLAKTLRSVSLGPRQKYTRPQTSSHEIGWYSNQLNRLPNKWNYPVKENEITRYARSYFEMTKTCLLYTSPSPRDRQKSRMPSSA
eukprot:TRINITY_DN5057_c0_g2_i1.p1 TRINITY_DN5057_c0_g2~~TRINITY_DN5057_c0_g2_i1.p1  ORF type:complete len:175 (-),score=49.15 TRINITY_DN5057_c0_g2_i1:7-531(-)